VLPGVGDALGFGALVDVELSGAGDAPGDALVDGDALACGTALAPGATLALGAAVAVGAFFTDATDATTGGGGAIQSSGCTTVAPVLSSYSTMRTPDSRAHASRLSWSVGVSVIVYRPRSGSASFASRRGRSTTANRSPVSRSSDQRSTVRWFLLK